MGRPGAPGTCGLIAALLICLLAGPTLLAAPAAGAGAETGAVGLRIGLEGAAFKDFLLFMGQFSGKNPVYRVDQLPDATVTLVSRQSVGEAELAEMQALVLGVAGLIAIPRGEVWYLLPDPKHPVQVAGPTQILAQRLAPGLDLAQAARVLEGLRSDDGQVAVAAQGHWLVLRDRAERVARARAVLAALDAASAGAVLELAPLKRAEARLAARKLGMHFRGLPGPAPVVLALEWSNSVLLAGGADQVDQARRLLSQIDEGGRAAPALRAFRLRYAKADKVAGVLRGLAAADKGLGNVRVNAEAGAVVVLAEPEFMAQAERVVEKLDQLRPRVLLEALVLELPARASGREILSVSPGAGMGAGMGAAGGAAAVANPPSASPAGSSGFDQAAVGLGLALRGSALGVLAGVLAAEEAAGPMAAPTGLDALAAQLAADPELRVLARPRAVVPDGGEMRLSITRPNPPGANPAGTNPAGTGPEVESQRLVFTSLEDAEGGQVSVRVRLEDADPGAGPQWAEARMPEGALLLLLAKEPGPAQGLQAGSQGEASAGWTLFSRRGPQHGSRRIGIVLTGRVVRDGESSPGPGRSVSDVKP